MAHTLSAQKRARQALKRKLRNKIVKSRIKTQVKKLRLMISQKKEGSAFTQELTRLYQLVDKAVAKGVIHKNKSARLKSRLSLGVNRLAQKTDK